MLHHQNLPDVNSYVRELRDSIGLSIINALLRYCEEFGIGEDELKSSLEDSLIEDLRNEAKEKYRLPAKPICKFE